MRWIETKFKKVVKCKVTATNGEVKIKFPKQNIGFVALQFEKPDGTMVVLRQWEVILKGDNLDLVRIK